MKIFCETTGCRLIIVSLAILLLFSPAWAVQDRLTLDMQQKPLSEILAEIRRQCAVDIVGLGKRDGELLSFSAQDEAVETAVKRLLRQLNESNYAFEYNSTRLNRVSVLLRARAENTLPPRAASPPQPPSEGGEQVVRIVRVNPGTQAESADLQQNDLIMEYDGKRIRNAQELVQAVSEKSPEDSVEMVLIREGETRRVAINGGMIGINIVTITVPASELKQ